MRHSVAIFLVVVVTVFAAIQPVRAIEVQRVVSPGGI